MSLLVVGELLSAGYQKLTIPRAQSALDCFIGTYTTLANDSVAPMSCENHSVNYSENLSCVSKGGYEGSVSVRISIFSGTEFTFVLLITQTFACRASAVIRKLDR